MALIRVTLNLHAERLLFALAVLCVPAAAAAAPMTSIEHRQAMERADAQYGAAAARCKTLSGNEREVCAAEAKAAAEKAKADADAAYRNTDTQRDTRIHDAQADYLVARAKCDAMSGDKKDACIKEAKRAEADAVAAARQSAMDDKLDVDYKMTIERCATLQSPAKDSCINDAKAKYGK